MLLPVLVFVFVTAAVLGVAAAVIYLPPRMRARRLEQRLREVSHPDEAAPDPALLMERARGPLPVLDQLVGRTARGASLGRLIEQSGVRTTPSAMGVASLVTGALVALVVAFFLPMLPVVVLAGVAGMTLPFAWLVHRRGRRFRRFEEQFPEALDLLSRAIRAGHAFQTAMGMVADEVPAPVGAEFKKTFERQNFGLPLKDAMEEMTERVPLLDVKFFVTAVAIQRETGGNLAEILDNLARVVRERFKILRQVRVFTAHGRFTGYVLMVLPAALAVVLSFINPQHMKPLFEASTGQMAIAVVIVMQSIGYFWIRQVIKIEV
jgi:tight adherence protein B